MIPNSGVRIFSGHPVRDRLEAYAERAGERIESAKRNFWERANPKIDRISAGLWSLSQAEKRMGRRAAVLKEDGLEKLSILREKARNAEEKAEKLLKESAARQVAKARALAMILAIWRTSYEGAEMENARKMEEGNGLPKPPRGGATFQDAGCWYNQCGGPRYPTSGHGAVATFNAEHKPLN